MAHHILSRGIHVVVGDRTLTGSSYQSELGFVRKAATAAFSFCVRTLVTGGLFDTQCGIKAIRGDIARELFPVLREDGFAGDVELLYVALKYNLEIKRVPARLEYQAPSSVRPLRDGLRMAAALLRMRRNHRRGLYRNERLEEMTLQDYWHAAE
jgi:dolichyl-phosphate beta-glucosyltransferase